MAVFAGVTFYHFLRMVWAEFRALTGGPAFDAEAAHGLAAAWGRDFLRWMPGWQVQVAGLANLPANTRQFVMVANHESGTDILALYHLGLSFRWLSKSSIFQIPMVGRAMRKACYIPITRGDKSSHSRALAQSEQMIRAGTPVLFFPEGTRSTLGHPKEFKNGAFRLAMACKVGVLPVALHGSGQLLKKDSMVPRAATMRVSILPLMQPHADEDVDSYMKRVRLVIVAEHAHLAAQASAVSE